MNKRNLYAAVAIVFIFAALNLTIYFFYQIMVIRRQSSIYKKLYEINGQKSMFGYDNINFKTVNLPKKQKYKNLCSKFRLKKFNKINTIYLNTLIIN